MTLISLDTETALIGPGAIAPKLICASFYDGKDKILIGNDDEKYLEEAIADILLNNEIVGQNIAFDLTVLVNAFPNLLVSIFHRFGQQYIHDIRIREKLINIGTIGHSELRELPDGSTTKISYSLTALEKKYLGIDREEQKKGQEDIWRLNYKMLDGLPVDKYPKNAYEYAIEDAVSPWHIYELQEQHKDLLKAEHLHVRSDFILRLMTVIGIRIDPEKVRKVEEAVRAELETTDGPLVEAGIMRPPEPPRPKLRGGGWTKGKPSSVNRTALAERIEATCSKLKIEPKLTPKGGVSADAEAILDLASHDEVLDIYRKRQEVAKIVTTYIPHFKWEEEIAERVHPGFDVLKDTGRISSRTNKLFPSCNIQNVDPRVRPCYIADTGYVLLSADYSGLELCSTAWKLKEICGDNKMLQLLNRGVDLHAYLGAVLAHFLDADFGEATKGLNNDQLYDVFMGLANADSTRSFFNHFRTFAKPTGLGYIGGLGPKTFINYAKTTYGVDIRQLASRFRAIPEVSYNHEGDPAIHLAAYLRELWFSTFPEMRNYFAWVDEQKFAEDKYRYETPMGMVRNGASFCAAANGAAMQSPSAEGFLEALWYVMRDCWIASLKSPLYGSIPLAPIHDELIVETPDKPGNRDEAAEKLREIMEKEMGAVLSGVPIKVKVAMMHRWDKDAKEQHNEDGSWRAYN